MKVLLSWSGGKDSSLALYEIVRNYKDLEIEALFTTLTRDYNRISMHGVRRDLLLLQSKSLQIPIEEVWIPSKASNEIYEEQMIKSITKWKDRGISSVAFGDLFLEDIRSYREKFLSNIGIECIFPLWQKDTSDLAQFFLKSGFKAILSTVDPKKLNPKFCGREYDEKFLEEIPSSVDPCGENGEFHTFVYDGPIFKSGKLDIQVGTIVQRDGFYFADLFLR
ncbi:MAG: Dph6-related ATP pyrophosphatase [Nitrososphaerales archaeon]